MLEWLRAEHAKAVNRLKALEIERYQLQGAIATLTEAAKQAHIEAGGGNVAAPAPAPPTGKTISQSIAEVFAPENAAPSPYAAREHTHADTTPQPVRAMRMPDLTGITKAVRVPGGPLQADEELRE